MGGRVVLCGTIPPLAGWRVGVTAHRRVDEQSEMLRRRGATVVAGPVVRTLPFGDDRPLREATEALLVAPPQLVVATTGIGIRSWFGAAETWGVDRALVAALDDARRIARGPKARAALAAVGLPSHAEEPTERLDALVASLVADGVAGRRVALQLYGEDVPWAVDRLGAAGADVVPVPIYRWRPPDDLDPARRLLKELLAGQLDAVTFTSAAAVRTLTDLAEDAAIGEGLRNALSSTALAACVGPVTAEAAAAAGFERRCAPDRGRLGLMVRALADALHRRHRHLLVGDHEVVVHGGSVWAGDANVVLTDLERSLFALLAERPHAVVSRSTLRQRIWGPRSQESAIDSAVSRLRKVLRPVGCGVDTVQRRGWTLGATEADCPNGSGHSTSRSDEISSAQKQSQDP